MLHCTSSALSCNLRQRWSPRSTREPRERRDHQVVSNSSISSAFECRLLQQLFSCVCLVFFVSKCSACACRDCSTLFNTTDAMLPNDTEPPPPISRYAADSLLRWTQASPPQDVLFLCPESGQERPPSHLPLHSTSPIAATSTATGSQSSSSGKPQKRLDSERTSSFLLI